MQDLHFEHDVSGLCWVLRAFAGRSSANSETYEKRSHVGPSLPALRGVEIFYIEDVDVITDVVGMVKAPCTEKLSSPTDLLAYAVSAK